MFILALKAMQNLRSKYASAKVKRMLKRTAKPRREAAPIQNQFLLVVTPMLCKITTPNLVVLSEP